MLMCSVILSVASGLTGWSIPLPSQVKMQRDLVGRHLQEGLGNGNYHYDGWEWVVEEGEIRNFRIIKEETLSADTYSVIVGCILTDNYRSYDATIRMLYVRRGAGPWILDYVRSLGLSIVRTGRYDDCIVTRMLRNGWDGSRTYLEIRNISDIPLEVGLDIYSEHNSGWKRAAIQLNGGETVTRGGAFSADGDIYDFRIQYVER